ncbi:Olfactory receptor 10AG1 [Sciurus carolinensis]|uniref:Olfactory receptor 10AG1 n=1 Tax=Sciurus carolinensis TaxID=30640 RepID=A0AA41MEN0_SCICA|nr:Olfactory receptor 10AG1 [Sciurus carolinensis]
MCFFLVLGTAECFLLAVMSYDRYVAICKPLHYPLVVSPKKCHQLAAGTWLGGMPVQKIKGGGFQDSGLEGGCISCCSRTQDLKEEIVSDLGPTQSRRMKLEEIEAEDNVSTVVQFVLLGFSELPSLQGFLSGLSSIIYMVVLIGNSLIVIITRLDPALHEPMYFFLANFSILEICYVSVTLPRMLASLWTLDRSISLLGCATQLCFFLVLGTTECFLLAVMSYDRYVAICKPLHYPLVMNPKKCHQLAAGAWLGGMPVQLASCGDTSVREMSVYLVVVLVAAIPFVLILVSYSKIIGTILRLPTAQGRTKAFSHAPPTCCLWFYFLDLVPLPTSGPHPVILQELTTALSVLHHSNSHVQSYDLQPQEPGCACCTQKILA